MCTSPFTLPSAPPRRLPPSLCTHAGCYILRPYAHQIWDKIHRWFDDRIAALGVENCYFPLLITKAALETEASHVEGFAAEVLFRLNAIDFRPIAWMSDVYGTSRKQNRRPCRSAVQQELPLPDAHHESGAGD